MSLESIFNTSRELVIDQEALVAALRSRQIEGAGLDVLAREPPHPSDPVLTLENVIVKPNIGWYSEQSSLRV
jgi:phosphoglycerate dehydrogenase-like enzyme